MAENGDAPRDDDAARVNKSNENSEAPYLNTRQRTRARQKPAPFDERCRRFDRNKKPEDLCYCRVCQWVREAQSHTHTPLQEMGNRNPSQR